MAVHVIIVCAVKRQTYAFGTRGDRTAVPVLAEAQIAAAGMDDGWIRCLIEGTVFALFLAAVSWLLKGRFGMGDAKLLGVTAMTAGWMYSLQVLFTAMALAFLAGVWLLLFRKMSAKTEMPFVPFLAAGMAVHFFMLLKL